jgi:hypothetical protein
VTIIANTTLMNALSLGVQKYQDIVGVLQATDAVASLLKYNYNPNDYRSADFNTLRGYLNNTAAEMIPVLSAFADLVTGAQVLGEASSDLIYDNFRIAAAVLSTSTPATAHAPQSQEERASVASTSSVTLSSSGVGAEVALKLVVMNPREYGADGASDFVSSPILLQVQGMQTNNEAPDELLSSIEFTFQHNEPQHQYLQDTPANFTTVCTARNASQQFSFVCPDSGHVLRHNCSQGAGTHTSHCPVPAPACTQLDYRSTVITIPSTCRVIRFDALSTTCVCNVTAHSFARRLSAQTAEQSILDQSGAADMMVSTVYIASNFADTFHSANGLNSPGAVSKVMVVIILLGMLWVPALLFVAVDWARPHTQPAQDSKSARHAKQKIEHYVRTIVPAVYSANISTPSRIWREITHHHTLLRLFTARNIQVRRMTICRTLTVLTFMLFLTAVFFDVSNPGDDGTCAMHSTEIECLRRTSPFDYSRTFCQWDVSTEVCSYNSEAISMTALFYLTVLTTILASIASVPVDYCFQILNAPTLQSLEGSKVANTVTAMMNGARRMSNFGTTLAATRRSSSAATPKALKKVGRNTMNTRSSKRFSTIIARDSIIANRELSEDFRQLAEEARAELTAVTATALSVIAQDDYQRRQRRTRSVRRATSAALLKRMESIKSIAKLDETRPASAVEAEIPFITSIVLQRQQMKDGAREAQAFDAQWGIVKVGGEYTLLTSAEEIIDEELNSAELEAGAISEALPNYSVQHAGLEILHLFMVDLLGRNTAAAKIFKEKFGEEFADSQVVVAAQKYAAGALLVGLNAFFMYFILLKGVEKGQAWQLQYLVCALIQVVIDVLVFETTECVWLNFVVPRTVQAEVATAAAILTATAEATVNSHRRVASPFFLNAPAHLFVSARVAKAHPQLLESLIVRSYSNHLPGQICKTWAHFHQGGEGTVTEVAVSRPTLVQSIMAGAGLTIQVCLAVPYLYQRILLRFVQPMAFSAVSVMWFSTIRSPSSMIAIGCALAACAAFYCWQRRAQQKAERLRSVLPMTVETEPSLAPLSDTFLDDGSGDSSAPSLSSEDSTEEWEEDYGEGSANGDSDGDNSSEYDEEEGEPLHSSVSEGEDDSSHSDDISGALHVSTPSEMSLYASEDADYWDNAAEEREGEGESKESESERSAVDSQQSVETAESGEEGAGDDAHIVHSGDGSSGKDSASAGDSADLL